MQAEFVVLEIALAIFSGLFAVLFWLLRNKDAVQQAEIAKLQLKCDKEVNTLWEKHDEDAKRLQDLELDIAKRHYVKDELDNRFERLESSIRVGLDQLGAKVDRLSEAIIKKETQ